MRSLTALLLAFCLGLFAVTAMADEERPLMKAIGDTGEAFDEADARAAGKCINSRCKCDPCKCDEGVIYEPRCWCNDGDQKQTTSPADPVASPPPPPAPYVCEHCEEVARSQRDASRNVTDEYLVIDIVRAQPKERNGQSGYLVGGSEWVPAAVFEARHFRVGKEITEDTVDRFIAGVTHQQLGNRTMATTAHTVIGFDTTKLANIAQTYAFDKGEATKVSEARVRAVVWELLGFAHQWAECGIQGEN